MRALRTISKVLILIPIAMLTYDLVNEWFVNARLKIQNFQEWLRWFSPSWPADVRPFLEKFFSGGMAQEIMNAPGPLVMVVPPVVMYVIYWIWFRIKGGHGAGKITFRSHD